MRSFSLHRLINGTRPSPYGFSFALRARMVSPQLILFSERWWRFSTLVLAHAAVLYFTPILLQHFLPQTESVPAVRLLGSVARILAFSLGGLAVVGLLIRRDLRITPRRIDIVIHLLGLRFWSTTCPRQEARVLIFRAETSGRIAMARGAAFVAVETPNDRFALAACPLKSDLKHYALEISRMTGLPIHDQTGVTQYV